LRLKSPTTAVIAILIATCQWFGAGCSSGPPPAPAQPSVGIWYRGQPAGTPHLDDLAVMRALDFSSVTWPASSTQNLDELRRQAKVVNLPVITRDRPVPLTAASALAPGEQVDVPVSKMPAIAIASLVWRAVAHGARVVAFDPADQTGSGLTNVNGEPPSWIAPAKALSRQISFNTQLIAALRPGPAVTIDTPKPAELDVVLFEVERSWVVIATSTSPAPMKATVHFPAAVPYALWVSLLDGSNMSIAQRGYWCSLELVAGTLWSRCLCH